ncbi:MAG: hypothetical protein KDI51_10775 [Xanthomonadales bacterium]|nr:hypothetical protein [Xanthomonadales bacterium]
MLEVYQASSVDDGRIAMRDLKPGEGQAAIGIGLLLWGLVVGGVGVATAGMGIGIPLIPVGIYLIVRGLHRKGVLYSSQENKKKNLEETSGGKFWLGMILVFIGVPAMGAGIGVVFVIIGLYLIWNSLTKPHD